MLAQPLTQMNRIVKATYLLLLVTLVSSQSLLAQSADFLARVEKDEGYVKASNTQIAYKDGVPKPINFVSDYENLFKDSEEKELNKIISDFEGKTTVEIAVITVDATMVSKDDLDGYALKVAQKWGLGKPEKDNGVIILLSLGHRTLIMRGGSGIANRLNNTQINEIVASKATPQLKSGAYFLGIKDSVLALIDLLK
ncbi:hypothetical protein D3C72_1259910 [compost metagenome]